MENNEVNQITITDVKVPFLSMVIFMVKAALASIPALIVLAIIGAVIFAALGTMSGEFTRYL